MEKLSFKFYLMSLNLNVKTDAQLQLLKNFEVGLARGYAQLPFQL